MCHVDQAGLEHREIHLPLLGIKESHAQLSNWVFLKVSYLGLSLDPRNVRAGKCITTELHLHLELELDPGL